MIVDTACRFLVYADMYNSPELKNEAVKFIAQNINSVIQVGLSIDWTLALHS